MISVTKVVLSRDIKIARIFLSIYSNQEGFDVNAIFNKIVDSRKTIKYKMGLQLKSKYVPEIEFIKDPSLDNYDHINRLLKNDG